MFSLQTTLVDENKSIQTHPRHRRKKHFKNKNKRRGNKKNINSKKNSPESSIATITMSSWAESFTHAATWQLKQQIAYWKAKATTLECENKFLHDVVRRTYVSGSLPAPVTKVENYSESEGFEPIEEYSDEEDAVGVSEDAPEFEVSEEFLKFLKENAKYKEEARLERERLKAERNPVKEMEAIPAKSSEDREAILKNLYGDNWERIAALETSMWSQYINKCDHDRPYYWPNIPLNFNF